MYTKLDKDTLALAYEIRCEYQWPWKRIAEFVGCNADHLAKTIRGRVNAE